MSCLAVRAATLACALLLLTFATSVSAQTAPASASDPVQPASAQQTTAVPTISETVVVTGRRVESRLADAPQKIEVVDAADIERTIANDVTDSPGFERRIGEHPNLVSSSDEPPREADLRRNHTPTFPCRK